MANVADTLRQAEQHLGAGRVEAARALLMRAVQREGADADLTSALALVLARAGERGQAVFYARRALKERPDHADFVANVAHILAQCGEFEEAEGAFRRALAASPRHPGARVGLAAVLLKLSRVEEAVQTCLQGLEHHPHDPKLVDLAAGGLKRMGMIDRGVELLRAAAGVHPDEPMLALELASHLHYLAGVDPKEVLAAHQRHGRILARHHPRRPEPFRNDPEPERRLRVGFLSPDFRDHSAAFFIEPVLERLDRARFEVFAYSTHPTPDAVTLRLRAATNAWRPAALMTDDALFGQIVGDRIDILIDLAGLTGGTRPVVLSRGAAPVQATYLGYPNTTGIPTIDYRIVDSVTDPAPAADAFATERLLRLDPCFLCYRPPPEAPPVAPLPAAANGRVTFGCFNSLFKVSGTSIRMWSKLLGAVPGSRLLLKNWDLALPDVRRCTLGRFAAAGLDPGRLDIIAYVPSVAEHLALYSRVDVALDTFPYHGTTTTCEAMHMGVPVLTLVGDAHVSRVGLTLLRSVGMEDLAAEDEDGFVRIGAALATDRARLGVLRGSLRDQLERSPLRDERAFAERFGAALRTMWHAWCADRIAPAAGGAP